MTVSRIPPAPWTVRGAALVVVGRLGRDAARELAGRARGLAAPWPLGSLAAVGFVRYDDTPVGPYHELTVAPGILWRDLPGALISHMIVDSERSMLAGRALWGLPKTLGRFDWQPEGVTVRNAAGTTLLAARYTLRRRSLPLATPPLPVFSLRGPRRQLFTVGGWLGDAQRVHVQLTAPADSPLVLVPGLLRGPHLALWIASFRLRVSTPFDLL